MVRTPSLSWDACKKVAVSPCWGWRRERGGAATTAMTERIRARPRGVVLREDGSPSSQRRTRTGAFGVLAGCRVPLGRPRRGARGGAPRRPRAPRRGLALPPLRDVADGGDRDRGAGGRAHRSRRPGGGRQRGRRRRG